MKRHCYDSFSQCFQPITEETEESSNECTGWCVYNMKSLREKLHLTFVQLNFLVHACCWLLVYQSSWMLLHSPGLGRSSSQLWGLSLVVLAEALEIWGVVEDNVELEFYVVACPGIRLEWCVCCVLFSLLPRLIGVCFLVVEEWFPVKTSHPTRTLGTLKAVWHSDKMDWNTYLKQL